LFIGLANALPVPLIGSNLSLYLAEKGFNIDTIGLFSLLGIPFSMKLLWSPIIDNFSPPFFSESPRKGWMLFALLGMIFSFFGMSLADPQTDLWLFVGSLFSLSAFTGCLYMVGLAYELESIDESKYSMGSASIVAGYRTGLLLAGAGVLYIAQLHSWPAAFMTMAITLLIGCIAILLQPEPYKSQSNLEIKRSQFALYPSLKQGFLHEIILKPCKLFFQRNDWVVILAVLLLFKVGNHMARAVEGPFYLSIGFDKADLALASKTWGFTTTILGALLAGMFLRKKNHKLSIALLGILHACSLLGYWLQALVGKSYFVLYLTVTAGNFTGGMAMTAFTFCLWKTCNKQYAATQYALFWSLFSLNTHLLSCFGGFLAASYSWKTFFFLTSVLGISSSLVLLAFTWVQMKIGSRDLSLENQR
jgi:MFS transporter, PAT family, beta-lactamase induction signal transducer AmpG